MRERGTVTTSKLGVLPPDESSVGRISDLTPLCAASLPPSEPPLSISATGNFHPGRVLAIT